MKAENAKERKREEKERKRKDLVWLIFFVFLESPLTRHAGEIFDAQTSFCEETDRGNGIATSKTASLP